jgi:plastocyanin
MMLRMVCGCTNHPLNVMGDSSAVNVESGAFCEYFHNAPENPRWAYLPRRIEQMRYFGFTAIAASALMLAACGGGEKAADTTAAAATPAADTTTAATTATATPAAGAVAAAPITGAIHEVKMIGDAKGYRFEPAAITIKEGDGIKYINITGGPHNVAFDPALIPAAVKPQLSANMPNQMTDLSGPLLVQPNADYTISFAKIPPGNYEAHCTPHLALNMKQAITVQ